jgi:imidazolonepropionase-like amidohydrolase
MKPGGNQRKLSNGEQNCPSKPADSEVSDMKRVFIYSIIISLLALSTSYCRQVDEPISNKIGGQIQAFTNVNLVRMTSEEVDPNQTLIVEGARIIEFGPSSTIDIPEDSNVIDGEGAYLMPGLADMHMHTKEDWLESRWPVSPLYLYLANGVTTIRDFGPRGNDLTYVLRWQDEINKGSRIGPTIYASGLRPGHSSAGNQDPQNIVRWNHAQGFDFLKMYSYISYVDFQAAMATARQLGIYTSGHIPYPVGLEGVIAEGYNEIAHIEELDWEFVEFNRNTIIAQEDWPGYLIGCVLQQYDIASGFDPGDFQTRYGDRLATVISLLQSRNIPLCTNMIVDDLIVEKLFKPGTFLSRPEIRYMPQDYLTRFSQGVEKHQMQLQGIEDLATYKYDFDEFLLNELHQAGIPLLLSTDAGTATMGIVPGFSIHDELRILIENGFTPYEAIATGTVNASKVVEAMTGENAFGTIEVGKRADLILVNGNPLEDVTKIKNILGVMAAGRWYSNQILDNMIEVIDPALVAYWALDETEGIVAHDSSGKNDANIIGDPVWQPDGGQVGGALEFDGVDDFISAPAPPNPADGPFSVFAWVKGGAQGQAIISEPAGPNWLSLHPSTGCLMTEMTSAGRGASFLASQAIVGDGIWHRVGLVWDGLYRTLFVDGVAVAQDTQDGLVSAANGLYIGTGKDMAPGAYFSGLIDDVRIYNRAVSP